MPTSDLLLYLDASNISNYCRKSPLRTWVTCSPLQSYWAPDIHQGKQPAKARLPPGNTERIDTCGVFLHMVVLQSDNATQLQCQLPNRNLLLQLRNRIVTLPCHASSRQRDLERALKLRHPLDPKVQALVNYFLTSCPSNCCFPWVDSAWCTSWIQHAIPCSMCCILCTVASCASSASSF